MNDEQKDGFPVKSTPLLDAINALHQQWMIETDHNRNIEWWGDEEWKRVDDKLRVALDIASNDPDQFHGKER